MRTLILAAIRCSMFISVTAFLFCARPAQAYIVTLEQVGSDVVATGSGAINLTGLTFVSSGIGLTPGIVPGFGAITMGPSGPSVNTDTYRGFTGPMRFGGGGFSPPTLAAEPVSRFRLLGFFSQGKV